MKQRTRKFIGIILTLLSLVAYALAVSVVFEAWLTGLPAWGMLVFFVVAGLGWALPAGVIIRWMARPDEP